LILLVIQSLFAALSVYYHFIIGVVTSIVMHLQNLIQVLNYYQPFIASLFSIFQYQLHFVLAILIVSHIPTLVYLIVHSVISILSSVPQLVVVFLLFCYRVTLSSL